MSKYTPEELKRMARQALFNPESTKFVELVITIAFIMEISPDAVQQRIEELAE